MALVSTVPKTDRNGCSYSSGVPMTYPIAPLQCLHVVDYARLKGGDLHGIETMENRDVPDGAPSLKNHDVDGETDGMFDLGVQPLEPPLE
ncbi:hypothetical protein BJV78DRAFT_1283177 [Lactifluus subvellereus]|nr:hypothetical protein BJV78DRAFT_1283177 [Lactifluus subvellereus]